MYTAYSRDFFNFHTFSKNWFVVILIDLCIKKISIKVPMEWFNAWNQTHWKRQLKFSIYWKIQVWNRYIKILNSFHFLCDLRFSYSYKKCWLYPPKISFLIVICNIFYEIPAYWIAPKEVLIEIIWSFFIVCANAVFLENSSTQLYTKPHIASVNYDLIFKVRTLNWLVG